MKRILLAVDGSDHSTRAVDTAATMARANGARLWIVAVVPSASSLAEDLQSYARTEHLLDELPSLLAGLQPTFLEEAAMRARAAGASDVSTETASGDTASGILESARDHNVDLIVVGSRGRGRLSGLLLGSVSQKVAAHAPCSVLIVR